MELLDWEVSLWHGDGGTRTRPPPALAAPGFPGPAARCEEGARGGGGVVAGEPLLCTAQGQLHPEVLKEIVHPSYVWLGEKKQE